MNGGRKRLRRSIDTLLEKMEESRQKEIHRHLHSWEDPDDGFKDMADEVQELLVDLGKNVVDHGIVLDPSQPSSSSSSPKSSSDPSDFLLGRSSVRRSIPRPLRHAKSPMRPRKQTSHQPGMAQVYFPRSPDAQPEAVQTLIEEQISPKKHSKSIPTIVPDGKSEPPQRSAEMIETQDPQSSLSQAKRSSQSDFLSVQASRYLLKLNSQSPLRAISGYVTTPKGPVQVTGLLDPKLKQNVVSLAFLATLELTIESPDDDKEVTNIDFGNGEIEKSIGQVVLEWSQGAFLTKQPLRVLCLVYEHGIRDFVFGEPFLRRKNH